MTDTKGLGVYRGGPTPEGLPPIPPIFTDQAPELPAELKATGQALLARITELAPACPPIYMESLVAAYGQLVHITRHGT